MRRERPSMFARQGTADPDAAKLARELPALVKRLQGRCRDFRRLHALAPRLEEALPGCIVASEEGQEAIAGVRRLLQIVPLEHATEQEAALVRLEGSLRVARQKGNLPGLLRLPVMKAQVAQLRALHRDLAPMGGVKEHLARLGVRLDEQEIGPCPQ